MDVISDLAELDRRLAACEAAAAVSDDALRALFPTFRMDFAPDAPADPFSAEYRDFQLALYAAIAGKPYALANERSCIDLEAATRLPFPYVTRSAFTAGHHLLAIGFMLCKLGLKPGARILEFGPGWGNTTLELARLGFDVTAVDIAPDFCELVRRRAALSGLPVTVVQADFFHAETVETPFDAVLFFECFHHCHDHMRLLRALHRAVAPGGSVFLASEPIIAAYGTPWGLRVDGEALWAIRKHGWLELGFDEAYFAAALARTGWHGVRHDCATVPWASVWQLRRPDPHAAPPTPPDPPLGAPTPHGAPVAEALAAELAAELAAVYRSRSWRLTAPLRGAARLLNRHRHAIS